MGRRSRGGAELGAEEELLPFRGGTGGGEPASGVSLVGVAGRPRRGLQLGGEEVEWPVPDATAPLVVEVVEEVVVVLAPGGVGGGELAEAVPLLGVVAGSGHASVVTALFVVDAGRAVPPVDIVAFPGWPSSGGSGVRAGSGSVGG